VIKNECRVDNRPANTVQNPLIFDVQLKSITSTAGLNGTTYAEFSHTFDDFTIPALSTANSGTIPDVLLTQGAVASLVIIPFGVLDVQSEDMS